MTSGLNLFCDILCKLRSSRGFFRHWALFLAFLCRRLGIWRQRGDEKRGAFPKVKQAECSSPGSFPNTGSSLDSRGYATVAASSIPESAGHPRLREVWSANQQPQQAASSTTPSIDQDLAKPSSIFDATTSIDSIRSRDKPQQTLHTPPSQPIQSPGDPHPQLGSGPSVLPPRENPSRTPSPRAHIPQLPQLETNVTNLHLLTNIDDRNSLPSAISHEQPSPPSIRGHRRRSSSASVVVGVETPSTKSLPGLLSPLANQLLLIDEPYTIGSPMEQPSTVADAPGAHQGSPQHGPRASSPSLTSNIDLPHGRILQMIHPEQVPRYTKAVTVPRERTNIVIPPLTTTFLHVPEPISLEQGSLKEGCAPWVPATHPDGALYFFDQDRRLFTDTDMHDPGLREEMEDFYHYLQRILRYNGVSIPSTNYDLVLDIMPFGDGQKRWSYYYASHETRCLFWLDPYDATHMLSKVFGVKSPTHVQHRLEDLYWNHWDLFPTIFEGRCLDPAVIDELVGMLSHGCMDVLTSKSSTLPFDVDKMQKMLTLVRNANLKKSDAGLVYHTAGVTRLLSFFAHWRFLHFHGQPNARLIKNQTVYTNPYPERTTLITLLSPAFFLAPEGYLHELEKTWVDKVIIEADWRNLIIGLLKEWEQLILASTVMLSVNVGFLAIPGVVISNLNSNITSTSQVVIFTSPAQIASCMSTVASAGSIVIGLLLNRHCSSQHNKDPAGAAAYLYMRMHPHYGLEPTAIIFSLPWALLMWAMALFFIALLLFCFSISNRSTRIFVAVTSIMMAALIWWCIQSFREYCDDSERGMLASRLRLFVAHAQCNVRIWCYNFFARVARRESPFSYGHSSAMPGHESVGV
ncbi:hypothetical protein EI94DRAFT_1110391 [Lactarius quietus]|nr:hypothetical protein EI94DRAFT_1110391 [Lactarius quietus]